MKDFFLSATKNHFFRLLEIHLKLRSKKESLSSRRNVDGDVEA